MKFGYNSLEESLVYFCDQNFFPGQLLVSEEKLKNTQAIETYFLNCKHTTQIVR